MNAHSNKFANLFNKWQPKKANDVSVAPIQAETVRRQQDGKVLVEAEIVQATSDASQIKTTQPKTIHTNKVSVAPIQAKTVQRRQGDGKVVEAEIAQATSGASQIKTKQLPKTTNKVSVGHIQVNSTQRQHNVDEAKGEAIPATPGTVQIKNMGDSFHRETDRINKRKRVGRALQDITNKKSKHAKRGTKENSKHTKNAVGAGDVPHRIKNIGIQPLDDWKDVWNKMKKQGWKWSKGSGLQDYLYWKPGVTCDKREGKVGVDFFDNIPELQQYVAETYGWKLAEASETTPTTPPAADVDDCLKSSSLTVEQIYESVSSDFKEVGFLKSSGSGSGSSSFAPIIELDPRELSHTSVFLKQWTDMVENVQKGETQMKRMVFLYGQYDDGEPLIKMVDKDEIIPYEDGYKQLETMPQDPLFRARMIDMGHDSWFPKQDRLKSFLRKEAEKNITPEIRKEYGSIYYASRSAKASRGPKTPVVVVSALSAPDEIKKEYFDIISKAKEENTPVQKLKRLVFRYGWNTFEILPVELLMKQKEGKKALHKVLDRIKENAKMVGNNSPFDKNDRLIVNALYHLKQDMVLAPKDKPSDLKDGEQQDDFAIIQKLMHLD